MKTPEPTAASRRWMAMVSVRRIANRERPESVPQQRVRTAPLVNGSRWGDQCRGNMRRDPPPTAYGPQYRIFRNRSGSGSRRHRPAIHPFWYSDSLESAGLARTEKALRADDGRCPDRERHSRNRHPLLRRNGGAALTGPDSRISAQARGDQPRPRPRTISTAQSQPHRKSAEPESWTQGRMRIAR